MAEGDLAISLDYRSPDNGAISGWTGPGWYLSAVEMGAQEWVVRPRRISPDAVTNIVAVISGVIGGREVPALQHHVREQGERAARMLRDRVKRLEATERELANAREELAQFEAEVAHDGAR